MRASRGMGCINPKKLKKGGAVGLDKLAKQKRRSERMGKRQKSRENLGNMSQRTKEDK
jgi:hypothetical protein